MQGSQGGRGSLLQPPSRQPALPQLGWDHVVAAAAAPSPCASILAHLDAFRRDRNDQDKHVLILEYVRSLPESTNPSQLVRAEMAYLCFAADECPILYDSTEDAWCVWDQRWLNCGSCLVRVKTYFQSTFLQLMRKVEGLAWENRAFPNDAEGKPHPRQEFLAKTVAALECREGAEKLIKENAM